MTEKIIKIGDLQIFSYPPPRTRKVVEEERQKENYFSRQERIFQDKLRYFNFN